MKENELQYFMKNIQLPFFQVFLCHRKSPEEFPTSFPKEVIEQRQPFVRMTKDSVVFQDDSSEKVDAVIFCTGYRYSFPFLSDDIITIKDERVQPIYKHMIHIDYPNLIFLGIPRQLLYFPHFYEMARFSVLVLEEKIQLPSRKDMQEASEVDFQSRLLEGNPPSFAHQMGFGDYQFRFNAEIAELGGFEPLPPVIKMIWKDILDERYINFLHCKDINYQITGRDSYRCMNPKNCKSRVSKAENVG